MTPGHFWANSTRSVGQDSPVLESTLQDRQVRSGNERDNVTLRKEWTLLCKSLNSLEARGGIEPPNRGFAVLYLTHYCLHINHTKHYAINL
jgi:hypothetical protein